MQDDFGMSSSQYSVIVLAFFISYLVFEVPANMILTRVRPSVFLPGLGLVWGTFAALMGATQNWSQMAGMRFLLGVAEVCRSGYSVTSWTRIADKCQRLVSLPDAHSFCHRGTGSTSLQHDTPSCTPRSHSRVRFRAFSLASSPTTWTESAT